MYFHMICWILWGLRGHLVTPLSFKFICPFILTKNINHHLKPFISFHDHSRKCIIVLLFGWQFDLDIITCQADLGRSSAREGRLATFGKPVYRAVFLDLDLDLSESETWGKFAWTQLSPIWYEISMEFCLAHICENFVSYLWKQGYHMTLLQIYDLFAIFESMLTEIWVTSSMANLDFLQFCETAFLPNSKFNWCTKKEGRKDVDRLKQGP